METTISVTTTTSLQHAHLVALKKSKDLKGLVHIYHTEMPPFKFFVAPDEVAGECIGKVLIGMYDNGKKVV